MVHLMPNLSLLKDISGSILFDLIDWFYGISTNVISIIKFRHTAKEFQILLFPTNNSIQHYSLICTQLNGSKYCYVSLTIQ